MSEEAKSQVDPRDALRLKLPDLKVSSEDPWADDLLDRKHISSWLTKLIQNQSLPFVIGIHGKWGTGKTFMLKRWQTDLENQGFNAIYFNAWEDDFCDDPLLAIIGQLSSYFTEDRFKEGVQRVSSSALPLIRSNVSSVLTHFTGLTTDYEHDSPNKSDLIKQYLDQRRSKGLLKKELEKLSATVYTEINHPLIFIVDELDRCRPTFAIELLERVKHIFDVPKMVFAFGLNRNELCKSLASVYGDIDTDVYLRRFFDFEFNLPEVKSQRFAEHLINSYQLDRVAGRFIDTRDFANHRRVIPKLWSALGLSLRDIDYGVRLLALLVRNVPSGAFTHPYLLAVLIAMKFKKSALYDELVRGDVRTRDIMDYIDGELRQELVDEDLFRHLDRIEGFLYCADNASRVRPIAGEAALDELRHALHRSAEEGFQVISRRAQGANPSQLKRMEQAVRDGVHLGIDGRIFGELAVFIDTHQTQLRR